MLSRIASALLSVALTAAAAAPALGQSAPPLPPGVLKDNVALLRQNEAEPRRLTRSSGRDNGT